jgi:hypothetical protein
LIKVLCVALWIAITHNLLIWVHHLQSVTGCPGFPAGSAGDSWRASEDVASVVAAGV